MMEQLLSAHLSLSEKEFLDEVAANIAAIAVEIETGRIIHANGEAEKLFRCGVKNGMSGIPYERLIPSELREKHANHVVGYKRNAHPRAMGDSMMRLRALTLAGDSFPVAISLRPIKKVEKLYVILTFMPLPVEGV